jgi:hypothetical protein
MSQYDYSAAKKEDDSMRIAKDGSNKKSRNVIGQISSCVDSSCQGWLVDSFLGKYWIRCKDAKHIENKSKASSLAGEPADFGARTGTSDGDHRSDILQNV